MYSMNQMNNYKNILKKLRLDKEKKLSNECL